MGAPIKYKNEYCKKAEEILAEGKSLAAVCAQFNIARSTLYEWKATYSEFKESIERGLQKCQLYWEQIGEDGIKGNYERFGSAPWIFTMKNRFREDYSEDKEDKKNERESKLEEILDRLVDK